MTNKAGLAVFRDMLTQVRYRINPLVEQGRSLAEVVAAKPTQPLNDKWGKGAFTPDVFVRMVYEGMSARKR